jgi:hypothetical protein
MPDDRLKFRCYRCNKLLGASPSKAGSIVTCPRCQAELVVPRPDEGQAPPRESAAQADSSSEVLPGPGVTKNRPNTEESAGARSLIEEIAAAIPEDLVSLRPEDIRVEAEFADLVIDTSETPTPPPLPISPPGPEAPVIGRVDTEALADPQAVLADLSETKSKPDPVGILPEITLESPSILPPRQEYRPVQEVVLQPATVLAWSLLVLMALPMAFIAGLLIGHFVWK